MYAGFKKLIDSGCVKGKVNLIDLPSEVTLNCTNPTDILVRLNSLLAEYRRYMTEAENAKSGRILLADQAHGVADVMKSCAVELCKTYSEYSGIEEALKLKLSAHGISCPELYVNGDDMEISAVICGKADIAAAGAIISDADIMAIERKRDELGKTGKACPSCGAVMGAACKFCSECGASLAPAVCGKCGAKLDADAKFCSQCGTKIVK